MEAILADQYVQDNGVSLDIINLETLYRNLRIKPVLVNDIAEQFSVNRTVDVINELVRTHYDEDELNTTPSCEFGCTTGNYNLGEICSECGTEVTRNIDRPLESQLWMKVPDRVTAFIHPRMWRHFEVNLSTKNFSLIEYLTNPTYSPASGNGFRGGSRHTERAIEILEEAGIERGINHFVRHFDYIMDTVLQPKTFLVYKNSNLRRRIEIAEKMRAYLEEYRDCVFTRYLPFPTKLIMVSERGGNMNFIDRNFASSFDAPKTIASIINSPLRLSDKVVQARTVKTIKIMSNFYNHYYYDIFSGKTGMGRRQLGSTRSPFTGRAVVAPLAFDHEYDEIKTPWSWTVTLLTVHICNKLLKMEEFYPQRMFRLIDSSTLNYNELIHSIIKELIAECPEGGIPMSMLRNPTLERLSNQYYRITDVLTDVDENAILLSVLVIRGKNADFDGDLKYRSDSRVTAGSLRS